MFIDRSKAFDLIDQQILKQKIKGIGITGKLYDLIESYLEERQQYTAVNGTASELKKVRQSSTRLSIRPKIVLSICE